MKGLSKDLIKYSIFNSAKYFSLFKCFSISAVFIHTSSSGTIISWQFIGM